MALTKEQYETLVGDLGNDAAKRIDTKFKELDASLNTKFQEVGAGLMKVEDFNAFKTQIQQDAQKTIEELAKLEEANKKQGAIITALTEGKDGKTPTTMKEFMQLQMPKLVELKRAGTGFIEITGSQLKAAGIQSIGGSVNPSSPYLPGLGGTPLEIFDIVRDPDFILPRVDLGSTDQSRIAWINEKGYEGSPNTNIAESGSKPQVQHIFSVEYSDAKKAAAYMTLTEEFETDLSGLASDLRGMLQRDVMRALDDKILVDIIAAAKPYNSVGEMNALSAEIYMANLWDAALALTLQPEKHNFSTNTLALEPLTDGKMQMSKNANGTYLDPAFRQRLENWIVRSNKLQANTGLAGDFRQYRVRIYKDYTLRMGWINDQFIKNEFAILGELRYHSFISDNRKWALAKGDLNNIADIINGTPGS